MKNFAEKACARQRTRKERNRGDLIRAGFSRDEDFRSIHNMAPF